MPRITTEAGYADLYSDSYGGTAGDVIVSIDVAFDTAPLASPTWTDVAEWTRTVSTNRGRSHEFDTFSTGTASIVLDNCDRRFEPAYASSPYYPNVKPNRRFQVTMNYLGTDYHLFSGFVAGWPQEYAKASLGLVQMSATDAFKVFARLDIPEPFIQLDDEDAGYLDKGVLANTSDLTDETTGARIRRVLTAVGWSNHDLDTGVTEIPGEDHGKGNVLSYLQKVAVSEDGRLFVAADGKVTFLDRHAPFLDSSSNTSQATFGDSGAELGYSDIRLPYNEDQIRNHVIIRMPDSAGDANAETSVENASSITEYLRTTYQRDVLFTDSSEAENLGEYILARYKDPFLRIEAITIKPLGDPTVLIPQVLGRKIGDRITVKRRPQGGSVFTQVALLEGISHTFTPHGEWTVTWNLSPADTQNYLILDNATFGLVETGRVGY